MDNISQVANGKCRAGGLMGEKRARHREGRLCVGVKKAFLFLCVILLCGCNRKEEYFFNKALDYEEIGEFEKANLYLEKVLSKNPKRIMAYVNKGSNRLELSDFAGAIEDYNQAIALDTMLVTGYVGLANTYMQLENFSLALSNYNIAISKSFNIIETDDRIIVISAKNPDFNVFGRNKKRNKYEDPLYSVEELFFKRGIAHFFLNNLPLAFRDLNFSQTDGITLEMKRDCHYWIGQIYLKAGQIDEACKELKEAAMLGKSYAQRDYDEFCK